MSLNKICKIWRLWNNREISEKDALLRIGEYAHPHLLVMDKVEQKAKLQGKCKCGHNKSSHILLEKNNVCSECYADKRRCLEYKPKNAHKKPKPANRRADNSRFKKGSD